MSLTVLLPPVRRALSEWLLLLGTLLALGSYVGYLQYRDYRQAETQERERLASQAEVIEKNLTPQLLLANRVIDSIIHELPSWNSKP